MHAAGAGGTDRSEALDASTVQVGVQLARALHVEGGTLEETLDAIIAKAIEVVGPATWAGIILVEDGTLVPKATVGDPPTELDLLQQREGEGPCLEAARAQRMVVVADTASDPRWPHFAQLAVELGARAVLCAPLWVDDRTLGTLSLYSAEVDPFSVLDLHVTELLTTHAALALGNAQHVDHLRVALVNRDVIGQGKGILMERHRLTADDAFRRLVAASQRTNTKLVDVARRLADTGLLEP